MKSKTPADIVKRASRVEDTIKPMLIDLLKSGTVIVLDFHANTVARRKWLKSLIAASQTEHVLHWLDVPDDVCKARPRLRNAQNEYAFRTKDEMFDHVTAHFETSHPEEGLSIH